MSPGRGLGMKSPTYPHARSAHKARISAEPEAGNRKEHLCDYASYQMPKATIEIPVQIERISACIGEILSYLVRIVIVA